MPAVDEPDISEMKQSPRSPRWSTIRLYVLKEPMKCELDANITMLNDVIGTNDRLSGPSEKTQSLQWSVTMINLAKNSTKRVLDNDDNMIYEMNAIAVSSASPIEVDIITI